MNILLAWHPHHEKMLMVSTFLRWQVISLMQKFLDSMLSDKPLQIKSAMCTDVTSTAPHAVHTAHTPCAPPLGEHC